MEIVDLGKEPVLIPQDVATCPSCHARLIFVVDAWTDKNHGDVDVSEWHAQCSKEPHFDAGAKRKRWEKMHAPEFHQPYIYWLPVDQSIELWMKKVQFVDSRIELRKLRAWNQWAHGVRT